MAKPKEIVVEMADKPAGPHSDIALQRERHVPAVYRQMVACAGDFAKLGLAKDSVNIQQQYKFRGIDQLMNLAAPIFFRHGLLVLPNVVCRVVSERETRSGSVLYDVVLDVEFTFVAAEDGSRHTVRFVGEASDSGDKATNKAMSAAFKYCLFECFCIPVEGGLDEADATTPEETVKAKPKEPAGFKEVKLTAFANARLGGTQALRDYARQLADSGKDSDGFKAWGHLVKVDPDYAELRKVAAEADDRADAAKILADKAQATREPGEEG